MSAEMGALVAALAKAHMQFAPVKRDKTVKVSSERTGKSYTFNYAPLDTILEAVRGPLSANGLAIVQMIDDGSLVTSLMHESGGVISGRVDLPPTPDIQAMGSAITYLRRYAIQAVLGIAAEDDDDGNRGAGNIAAVAPRGDLERNGDGSIIGTVTATDKQSSDFSLKAPAADGLRTLGFRLQSGGKAILVETRGALAEQLDIHRERVIGQRVTVWGTVGDHSFPKGTGTVTYQVLAAERMRVPEVGDLPTDEPPEAESLPLFSPEEQAALDEAVGLAS